MFVNNLGDSSCITKYLIWLRRISDVDLLNFVTIRTIFVYFAETMYELDAHSAWDHNSNYTRSIQEVSINLFLHQFYQSLTLFIL